MEIRNTLEAAYALSTIINELEAEGVELTEEQDYTRFQVTYVLEREKEEIKRQFKWIKGD